MLVLPNWNPQGEVTVKEVQKGTRGKTGQKTPKTEWNNMPRLGEASELGRSLGWR